MGLYTFLKVIAFVALLVLGYMYYLGFWDPQKAIKVTFEGCDFLYFEAQCPYKDVGELFSRMEKDISDTFEEFEYTSAGVYFDNPEMVVEPHMTRSAIGIIPLTD